MNKAAYFALLLLGACAGQTPRAETIRKESGALGEETFLEAPWRSSNIDQTAMEDGQVGLVVVALENGSVDSDLTAYLETELNALQRFPVVGMAAGGSVQDAISQLASMGEVASSDGSSRPTITYQLELSPKRRSEVRDGENYSPLSVLPVRLHEFWYEGPANLYAVEGGVRRAAWGDRTFRSRSSWKWEGLSLGGDHRSGFNPSDSNEVELAYLEARSSLLFNFSKEVYSKLGRLAAVENALRSGSDVLLSTPLGSRQGVMPGQPMFIMYREGNLEVFLAKALAQNVTSGGATLRVIQWKRGDAQAQEFADDPSSFVARKAANVVARTEGLALPESWSERSAELDRLLQKYADDAKPYVDSVKDRRKREVLRDLISGQ